jgi:hypothetical protein
MSRRQQGQTQQFHSFEVVQASRTSPRLPVIGFVVLVFVQSAAASGKDCPDRTHPFAFR